MGSKGSQTVNQNQTYTPNPVAGQAITNALGQTQQVAQTPFQTPVAPVAGFSADQGYGFDTMRNAVNTATPYLQQAASYFSPAGIQQFLNPYASNVMASMKDLFGQQMSETTGNLTQQAGGTGADRIAVGQANLARQQDLAAGQTMSGLYSGAAQQAQGAGFGLGSVGPAIQNMLQQGAQGVLGTGGLQQQLAQAQMNAPYQNILQQIMWPYQNAQFLNQGVAALAPGLGGTTTGQTIYPAQNPFGQYAGIAMAGLGAYGGAGGFSGSGNVAADPSVNADTDPSLIGSRGGRVPGYAEGGAADDNPNDLGGMVSTHPMEGVDNAGSLIPTGQITPIKPNIPQLQQPQKSGDSGGGSDWVQAATTAAKLAMMFANRGGRVSGYAMGGAPTQMPQQSNPFVGFMQNRFGLGQFGPAINNVMQSWQGGQRNPMGLARAFGQGAQPGSPTALLSQGTPGLQQLMRSGGLKGMMGGGGGGMPGQHGQPTMADGGEVDDLPPPESMADVSRGVPGHRDVLGQPDSIPRGLMRPESPDLAGPTMRALPRAIWPHTTSLLRGEDTPPPEIEGAEPGKVPSFENQHVMGAIPELLETAGSALPAGRLATGAARMVAPLARGSAAAGNRTLQNAALGATGAAAASPAGADEIDDLSKPTPQEQEVIGRVVPLIAIKKKEYRDKYESKKMEDARPAIRLKAEIRDLENELQKVEGPGTDLAARREQARKMRADKILRTQTAGEDEATRLAKANEPFATRHPDDVEWRRKNMPTISGLTGLTAGLLSRGRPLRALGMAVPAGALEGAWAAGRPTFDDMAFLPSGPNQKAAADRFWGRGDEDWWSNRVLPDAMMHAGYAGAGALIGSEGADVAGRLGRGVRGVANWARGRGAAAAPVGEGVVAKGALPAAEAGAPRTATLPDKKTVIKRFEYPQRDGSTRVKYHNGKSWVARKNLKGVPDDFARGGGNPYFADGGAPDFEDNNQWTPELNDRFNAAADPYPGEDPRSPNYQMPGEWNARRKVTDATSFPAQEDDALPPEVKEAAYRSGRSGAGALPAPTGGGGGYGNPYSSSGTGQREKSFMDGPWGALMMAGLGTLAASGQRDARGLPTPPLAAIGQGGMQGLGMLQKQRENAMKQQTVDQGAERLRQQMELHRVQMMAPVKIGMTKDGLDVYGVRDPQTGKMNIIDPQTGEYRPQASGPGNQPGVQPPPAGATPTRAAEDGILPVHAQLAQAGPYDYSKGAPYLEKGMEPLEPESIAGKSPRALQTDAEYYLQTGKLPPVRSGRSPVAIAQQHYRDAVQNYGNSIAQSRGVSAEQMADMWRSSPGMLRFILGPDGRSTVALGTAVRHLDTVRELAKAWAANDMQAVNRLRAVIGREFGQSAATNLETAGRIVGPEIIKAIGVAGAGTAEERHAASVALGTASTPEQLLGAIETTQKLLGGQLEGRKRQAASAGVSEERFKNLIGERPYELLSGADKVEAPATARPAGIPEGAKQAPDKKWYIPDPKRPGKYLEVRP